MTALLIILVAIVLLALGYVFYGNWLVKQWGVDPNRKTPAIEMEDGVDYVAAKPAVLMGHHFSSIAGAGPINGTDSGIHFRMASGFPVVCNWWYLLWRSAGLRFSVCIHQTRRKICR